MVCVFDLLFHFANVLNPFLQTKQNPLFLFFSLGDVKIKKAPKRTEILAGIDNVTLKHAETVDKSAPIIESDVHIKPSAHAGLMAAIKKD